MVISMQGHRLYFILTLPYKNLTAGGLLKTPAANSSFPSIPHSKVPSPRRPSIWVTNFSAYLAGSKSSCSPCIASTCINDTYQHVCVNVNRADLFSTNGGEESEALSIQSCFLGCYNIRELFVHAVKLLQELLRDGDILSVSWRVLCIDILW